VFANVPGGSGSQWRGRSPVAQDQPCCGSLVLSKLLPVVAIRTAGRSFDKTSEWQKGREAFGFQIVRRQ